jgi:hypothetical protein
MSDTNTIPPPDQIAARMQSCRAELAALRKLYRAAIAAKQADEARAGRAESATPPKGGCRGQR